MHLAIKIGGVPHLAKNERDMGHPSFVRERVLQWQVSTQILKMLNTVNPEEQSYRAHFRRQLR
jgi:hypothetical protein